MQQGCSPFSAHTPTTAPKNDRDPWRRRSRRHPAIRLGAWLVCLLPLLTSVAVAGGTTVASSRVQYHWSPPAPVDADGVAHAPAVAYRIQIKIDGGAAQEYGTVADTVCSVDLKPDQAISIRVIGVDAQGRSGTPSLYSEPVSRAPGVSTDAGTPTAVALGHNYPNPFNPSTTLPYTITNELPAGAAATLEILDLRGRRVRLFRGLDGSPGDHAVVWDGRDGGGRPQPSGAYFARLRCGGFVGTMRMTLAR